jgi:hypothetical protein
MAAKTTAVSLRTLFHEAMSSKNSLETVSKMPRFTEMMESVYDFMISKSEDRVMTPQHAGEAMIIVDFVPLLTTVDDLIQWIPQKPSLTKPEFVAHVRSVFSKLIQQGSFRAVQMLIRESTNETEGGKLMNNMLDESLNVDTCDTYGGGGYIGNYMGCERGREGGADTNPYINSLNGPGYKTLYGMSHNI